MTPLTLHERISKFRHINSLMSACRLIPNRTDILALWNVQCYDDLADEEIVELQAFIETAHRCKTTPAPDAIRRLRSQVLSVMTKIGMYTWPDDWVKVNRTLLQRRVCGKLLYMLDAPELQALVRKLRAIGDKRPAATSKPSVQVAPIILLQGMDQGVVN